MRKNFGATPILYPQPVFIIGSYDQTGVPNAMAVAWGGLNGANKIFLHLSPKRKTVKNILVRGAFTVSMATATQLVACDYVGLVSGNDDADKFTKAGFHEIKSNFVDAPLIQELPMSVECKLISYDSESGQMMGEILNVCADQSILTNGIIDPDKLQPITNGTYLIGIIVYLHYIKMANLYHCQLLWVFPQLQQDEESCRRSGNDYT